MKKLFKLPPLGGVIEVINEQCFVFFRDKNFHVFNFVFKLFSNNLDQLSVVKKSINFQMILKSINSLCATPSPSHQAINICPQHGKGMIDRKKRIIVLPLEFTLSCHTSRSPFVSSMLRVREIFFYQYRIELMLISFY